jgi:hypothetical protein
VAKFATIGVLWTVAFVSLTRAQHLVSSGRDPDPLLWSDVERHLQRAERRERRRGVWLPPAYEDPPASTAEAEDPQERGLDEP